MTGKTLLVKIVGIGGIGLYFVINSETIVLKH